MQGFDVDGSELLIGGRPLSALVEQVGQTPFYAYDRSLLRQRVAQLRAALPAAAQPARSRSAGCCEILEQELNSPL